ncbi:MULTISPECIES: STM3941 family protein [Flavobacterium]|uniref:PH domain-containing protein n=1 Tax=Flavobacterium hankyongi TaxID=1176532 RepID=A0ABP8ZTE4_9FLAO|nr:STM3941 family protein [Flavobacterium sp. N1846]
MTSNINIPRNKKSFNKLLLLIPLTFIPVVRVAIKNTETNIIISILLFLYCILMILFFINALKKTNKTSPALIINNDGLIDNISLANAGLITWNEITNFEVLKSGGSPHLFIFVKNPEKFIKNKPWFTKGMVTQMNKDKGSPIAIDLNQIDINPKELLETLSKFK